MLRRPDPATATEREVFEYVRWHLLKQGERASARDLCVLRDPYGLTCALGCLIPEDEYRKEMEGNSNVDLFVDRYRPAWKRHEGLLTRLQRIHDDRHPSDWEARLDDLAAERGWL